MKKTPYKRLLIAIMILALILTIAAYVFGQNMLQSERADSINQVDYNIPLSSFMLKES
ncbi:hypothetical protein [Francisella sp. 19X1-34]|uniref:hypothetical protein n=1 Tax=Francisella sp. 19X1-34 TaxID=3087177 RepID=UPI002E3628A9|nr:hypothetical protein [Francisella sp. 19X1-34]MED7787991.1 hypothetical protein [Francisella sp. 19X1-34]